MKKYLLDTNVLSQLVRNPGGNMAFRIGTAGGNDAVYTSVIVAAELRFGAAKRGSQRLTEQLEVILGEITIEQFETPTDQVYAQLRADLERRGTPIGANDLWIAAQALHDGSVLVTDNTREFCRVPELMVENWLKP